MKPKTLKWFFEEFRKECLPTAPESEVNNARLVFFAGAGAALSPNITETERLNMVGEIVQGLGEIGAHLKFTEKVN